MLIGVGAWFTRLKPSRFAAWVCAPCPFVAFGVLVNNLGSNMTNARSSAYWR